MCRGSLIGWQARVPTSGLGEQTREQAEKLMKDRLTWVREQPRDDLFPFPTDLGCFGERVLSSPRRLVQTCSVAISEASADIDLPFDGSYIEAVVARLYPEDQSGQEPS